ncbi:DsbA family protein [Neopusillimonas maritima]|jgi:2-hydroxychromene-2-carboxylate isomerase/predicted thioesterase|uniref:2-hydroxychromene-2-carboxylate isomerase n=1 Tax=Neopusillimonas maritima TaxID=2026239 RepID=A0ABX9MV70_9BURK|nr:DsbA family protein [Neopusillimonas maritima]MBF23105.1 2-hydroxychromene-2-carboxylate isomerase [Pusillimonas sp.]RII82743.1 hypothetical protein CJO09_09130 [Neopusillimonas maritima]|tara:strand:+ start:173 stop:1183 length:1011 start_codon:yes stop_codon:yes gene_type:complete
MTEIRIGLEAEHRVVPGKAATAEAIGNDGVNVVSTPYVISLLEETSHRAIRDYFPPGHASVGTKVEIRHLAPAFPDTELVGRSKVVKVEGRKIGFEVTAMQGESVIMEGYHERALVNLEKFHLSKPALEPSPALGTIDFYFDYHSPWCYLAALRIEAVAARCGRSVVWKPLHLANLIEQIDGRRPLDANPAFVRWFKQDMQDWANLMGVRIAYHPNFPLRPSRALRASAYAQQQGCAPEFVKAVMKAYWSDNLDISDLQVLGQIGNEVGLESSKVVEAAGSEMFKRVIETNTQEAIARSVFGAPTFIVDDQLFWGNDRIDVMEMFLSGKIVRRAVV